jgi:cytochrome o ubiquinol oxidase subunit 2
MGDKKMPSKRIIFGFFLVALLTASAGIATYFFSDKIAVLNPMGRIAAEQKELILTASWLMLLVVLPVFAMTFFICWKYMADNPKGEYTPDWDNSWAAEAVWWGFPFIIICILSVITWKSSHALDPYREIASDTKPLTIQVVALQWKWLFVYPEQQIATVNFAQIPENTPINFELTADAPMNSFWVPQLGGQIYTMPGMRSKISLIADKPGSFYGTSANISGVGFSGMTFTIQASPQEEFEQWVAKVKQSPVLNEKEYLELAQPSEYNPVALYSVEKKDLFNWILHLPMADQEKTAPKTM